MIFLAKSIDPLVKLLNWSWLSEIGIPSIIFRLLLAILCGGILGVERAKKHQAAGFRTYIIVCLGSTVAMMTNEFISVSTNMGDSARLGAQVISGIGFLGAGTILVTSRNQIRGLTTAAGLWSCACLGLAIGIGYYTLALLGGITIAIVLAILPKIEEIFTKHSRNFEIHIEFQCRENLKEFVNYVRANGLQIVSIEHNQAYASSGLSVYTISFIQQDKKRKNQRQSYIDNFSGLPYVNYVEIIY